MEIRGIIFFAMFVVSLLSLLFTEVGIPWAMYIVAILTLIGLGYFIFKTSNMSDT